MKNRCQADMMESNKNYQERIGELLYIGVNARPDILAPVCILSQHTTDPTIVDWTETKQILKYLKGTMQFQLKLGNIEERNTGLVAYSNADWAQGRSDRKSISRFLVQLHGSTIAWGCRKQTCVALSTTEAEYVALVETCKELLWIHQILEDFDENITKPTTVLEDKAVSHY
ncbi:uncharacterized protein [Temnothorax longispinosus]|uniref:uncharacterized protein n=1 Tax=Temnothorax longispinosus TaxID=300112 RepID=UPI003A994601